MEQSKYAKAFKALSNEQRLNIFLTIYRHCRGDVGAGDHGGRSCCGCMNKAFTSISRTVSISPSTTSHHLKELQESGLIICERNGQSYDCRVNMDLINEITELLT
ncbi:MAG: hypothetical protein A2Y33_06620 [Spirochaetes bacterium GWF1_51_8]|nr:MAG: hypothetical protein A2Y33_06620 [Spirochaetes bacterium GWF1_51_8]